MTVKEFFAKHPSASSTAREWCEQYATMSEAWAACKRSDWMLWALRAEENTEAAWEAAWEAARDAVWEAARDARAAAWAAQADIIREVMGDPFAE